MGATRRYAPGQHVEYNSLSNGRWIEAVVDYVHSDGTVDLDVRDRADARYIRELSPRVQWVQSRVSPRAQWVQSRVNATVCKTNRDGATDIDRDDGVYHAAEPKVVRSTRPANLRQARVVDARPAPRSRVVLHAAHVASGDCLRAVGANSTEAFRPQHPRHLTADLARSVR